MMIAYQSLFQQANIQSFPRGHKFYRENEKICKLVTMQRAQ